MYISLYTLFKSITKERKKFFWQNLASADFRLSAEKNHVWNIVVEVFWCSTTKEATLAVCSAKSNIQIPNIYTLRYATTKNYYVVIGIIVVTRTITVCRDTAHAILFIWSFIITLPLFINSNSSWLWLIILSRATISSLMIDKWCPKFWGHEGVLLGNWL